MLTESQITVRLAQTPDEVREAQAVRYQVFCEEMGAAPSPEMLTTQREFDAFDDVADHLIVLAGSRIVGTYRLMHRDAVAKMGRFYSASEYDLSTLAATGGNLLELGRSCVLAPYRSRPVLQKMWGWIADYLWRNKIDTMFGCGCLVGTDVETLSDQLSYLYHYHLANTRLRTRAQPSRFVEMNRKPKDQIDARAVFSSLPPLIKGYLRLGAMVGDGAVIDHQWNSVDVCIIVPCDRLAQRYTRHFARSETANYSVKMPEPEAASAVA